MQCTYESMADVHFLETAARKYSQSHTQQQQYIRCKILFIQMAS